MLIQQQLSTVSSKISIRLIASIWTMDILHESASSLQKTEPIAAKWNKNERLFAKWKCMFCRSGAAQYSHCDLRIAFLVSYNLGITTKFTNKLPKFAAKASKITNTFSMLAEWTVQSLGAASPAISLARASAIVGGKQFVQVYVRAAVHHPSEIVYYF